MIHILVLCGNEERKQFQKKQFAALQLPYDVTYIGAYTPDTSADYMNDYDSVYPEANATLCCMRSHAAAIDWFVHHSDQPYALIMEDDVCLLQSEFATHVESVLQTWSRHDSLDYVSIGYLPGTYDPKQADGNLYWDSEKPVWGAQAYLVSRAKAVRMAEILHQPSARHVRERAIQESKQHNYSTRYLRVQSDALLPILFQQGFVQPMLAIEAPLVSMINQQSMMSRWAPAIASGAVDPSRYFGAMINFL
jgi:GR25 family glycosyltransferase involved in LPS biosynthesis